METKGVLTDRAVKQLREPIDANPSVEMLISCVHWENSSNHCAPLSVDLGWNYIEHFLPNSLG